MGVLILYLKRMVGYGLELEIIYIKPAYILIILRCWLTIMIIIANIVVMYKRLFLNRLKLILIFLILSFSSKSLISYYFYFEATLLPVFILVII